MSKVEGGGGPIDPPSPSRLRVTIFFWKASGVKQTTYNFQDKRSLIFSVTKKFYEPESEARLVYKLGTLSAEEPCTRRT